MGGRKGRVGGGKEREKEREDTGGMEERRERVKGERKKERKGKGGKKRG